jgi:ferredoxin
MAKIIQTKTGQEIEVNDGESIKEACEKLGVPFGCQNGLCGTCMIDVDSGEDNLSELTEEEEILERDKKHRLACQCKIKEGEVGIGWED